MARTRSAFRKLADIRVREAKALLDAKLWSGADYLAGYAVECGLKACIAKMTRRFEFPDKEMAARAWTHDLDKLLDVAELQAAWDTAAPKDSPRWKNWRTVRLWSERQRYERKRRADAEALYLAITDPTDGVLTWIAERW